MFMNRNNVGVFLLLWALFLAGPLSAAQLRLHHSFDESLLEGDLLHAEVGAYSASLRNGAQVQSLGAFRILNLGASNGYLDLGAAAGGLMNQLEDFTMSTYLYVGPDTDLSVHGNFVWNFGHSTDVANAANGVMFFSARGSRFAISETHWQGEEGVNPNFLFPKGAWQHLVYTQEGATGTIYLNGTVVGSGTVNLTPADLGATLYNFLGRASYASDAYLKNALYSDFRIYEGALDAAEVGVLGQYREDLQAALIQEQLERAAAGFELEGVDAVVQNLELPSELEEGIGLSWSSSHPEVLSNSGEVTRPAVGADPFQLNLTLTLSKEGQSLDKVFAVSVLPWLDDAASVIQDVAALSLSGNLQNLRSDLLLPTGGVEGSVINWTSSEPGFIADDGSLQSLAAEGAGKQLVVLTARVSKGAALEQRDFEVWVAEDEGFDAYLFAYFLGNGVGQEAVCYAVSEDGYNFTALNNNRPVIAADTISSRGGVRDPHILRGPDGWFYMVLTDLYVPNDGWSNHAMVFLRSRDLIDWEHSVVNIPQTFPEFADVSRVWAPQSYYDEKEDKIMVYFSMLQPGGVDIIYHAYANADFTGLEGAPQQLLFHPEGRACIDGDIVFFEDQYHLFFKTEGSGNGIMKAVSDELTGGYVVEQRYLQQTSDAVEGSCVYRLTNTDTFVLMYDVYMRGAYQFTRSSDLANFEVIDHEVSMDFYPRHGTVIALTAEELAALNARYGDGTTQVSGTPVDRARLLVRGDFAGGQLWVEHKGRRSESALIKIYSLTGALIHKAPASGGVATRINTGSLPAGRYVVVFEEEGRPLAATKLLWR